jgi:xanthine dehydrogenase molybdenum-binding subunit
MPGKMLYEKYDLDSYFEKYSTILDMLGNEAILVELGDPTVPFGAKSMGKSGLFLQAPAITNAIRDAIGVLGCGRFP